MERGHSGRGGLVPWIRRRSRGDGLFRGSGWFTAGYPIKVQTSDAGPFFKEGFGNAVFPEWKCCRTFIYYFESEIQVLVNPENNELPGDLSLGEVKAWVRATGEVVLSDLTEEECPNH